MAAKKRTTSKSSKKTTTKTYSKSYSYGYGKRPLWQWIVLYLVLGVIVYGLIYYFVLGNSGGYNYKSPAPTQNYQYPSK